MSSLRLSNVPVRCASAGQTVTFKLAECVPPAHVSAAPAASDASSSTGRSRSSATGLVLLSPPALGAAPAQAHWEFEAEVLVLNHPSKIRVNYEPVVHIDCVKQSAKLVSITKMMPPAGDGKQHASAAGTVAVGGDEVGNGERALCRYARHVTSITLSRAHAVFVHRCIFLFRFSCADSASCITQSS